jgi:hypothetical protein
MSLHTGAKASPGRVYTTDSCGAPGRVSSTGALAAPGLWPHYTSGAEFLVDFK